MAKDSEPTNTQKQILEQLTLQSKVREEAINLLETEGSNDSVFGLFHEIDETSEIRNRARDLQIPEIEIARAILRGISDQERQSSYLRNSDKLTVEETEKLARDLGIFRP